MKPKVEVFILQGDLLELKMLKSLSNRSDLIVFLPVNARICVVYGFEESLIKLRILLGLKNFPEGLRVLKGETK